VIGLAQVANGMTVTPPRDSRHSKVPSPSAVNDQVGVPSLLGSAGASVIKGGETGGKEGSGASSSV
jgi:hypothetical protein